MQVTISPLPIQLQHESVLALSGELRRWASLASKDETERLLTVILDIENRLLKPTQTRQSVLQINVILNALIGNTFLMVKLVNTDKIEFVFDFNSLPE